MKKIITSISLCYLLITQVYSQDSLHRQDTRERVDTQSVISQPPVPNRQVPKENTKTEFIPENLERLQPAEVPPMLRKTLDEEVKYRGWEKNGVLYRNIISHEYMLEIQHNQAIHKYYFDRNGKPVEE